MTEEFKNIAIKAAKETSKILMKNWGRKLTVTQKGRTDILTNVDKVCEQKIISLIRKKYPDHKMFSEEIKKIGSKSDYLWIIDPLDGTVNYAAGQPLFSVSLCLLYKRKPILGLVYAPYLNELFVGIRNRGAFLNNKRIFVSKNKNLKDSLIYFTLSAHYSKKLIKQTLNLCHKITPLVRGIRIYESGALSHCYLACGRLDGKISVRTDHFSSAAGVLIIQEAGGKITDLNGKSWNINKKSLVCSNGLIHNKILNLTKKIRPEV